MGFHHKKEKKINAKSQAECSLPGGIKIVLTKFGGLSFGAMGRLRAPVNVSCPSPKNMEAPAFLSMHALQ